MTKMLHPNNPAYLEPSACFMCDDSVDSEFICEDCSDSDDARAEDAHEMEREER